MQNLDVTYSFLGLISISIGFGSLIAGFSGTESLALFIILTTIGIWLVIHSMYKTNKNQEVRHSFKLAWQSIGIKIFTLASISSLLTFSTILTTYSFDIESTVIDLRNENNELKATIQNITKYYNDTINELKYQNNNLSTQNQQLSNIITSYQQQQIELKEDLQKFMVEVTGSINEKYRDYTTITYTSNGIEHTVEIINGEYSIRLENNQVYSVKLTKPSWVLFWEFAPVHQQLSSYTLNSASSICTKNW